MQHRSALVVFTALVCLSGCDSGSSPGSPADAPRVDGGALPDSTVSDISAPPDLGLPDTLPDGPDAFSLPPPPTTLTATVVG
jgi:hypothetical protein